MNHEAIGSKCPVVPKRLSGITLACNDHNSNDQQIPPPDLFEIQRYKCLISIFPGGSSHDNANQKRKPQRHDPQFSKSSQPLSFNPMARSYEAEWDCTTTDIEQMNETIDASSDFEVLFQLVRSADGTTRICADLGVANFNSDAVEQDTNEGNEINIPVRLLNKVYEKSSGSPGKRIRKHFSKGGNNCRSRNFVLNPESSFVLSRIKQTNVTEQDEYSPNRIALNQKTRSERYLKHLNKLSINATSNQSYCDNKNDQEILIEAKSSQTDAISSYDDHGKEIPSSTVDSLVDLFLYISPCGSDCVNFDVQKLDSTKNESLS